MVPVIKLCLSVPYTSEYHVIQRAQWKKGKSDYKSGNRKMNKEIKHRQLYSLDEPSDRNI